MYSYAWAEDVFKALVAKYGRVHTYCRRIVAKSDKDLVAMLQQRSEGWEEYKRMLKAGAEVLARVGWDAMTGPNYYTFVQQLLHKSLPHPRNTLFGDLDPRDSVQYAQRAQNYRG